MNGFCIPRKWRRLVASTSCDGTQDGSALLNPRKEIKASPTIRACGFEEKDTAPIGYNASWGPCSFFLPHVSDLRLLRSLLIEGRLISSLTKPSNSLALTGQPSTLDIPALLSNNPLKFFHPES